MNSKILIPALIALMGVSAGAWADKPDPDDDGDVTITLMPPGNGAPEIVMKQIELPDLDLDNETANDKVENARQRLNQIETSGNAGREHGWSHANEAHQRAQDMAENASNNRESRGRSEDKRPERPEPPNPPGPPEDRPGQP
jgi:hypothetical protein